MKDKKKVDNKADRIAAEAYKYMKRISKKEPLLAEHLLRVLQHFDQESPSPSRCQREP